MSFAEHLAADRRLAILRILDAAPEAEASEATLQLALRDYAHAPSVDVLRADLAWLAEVGLVQATEIGGLLIARITPRGADVAHRRARVPGVAVPRP